MSALIASQVCCLFLLLIGTFLFGILPIQVQKTLLKCDCVGECKVNCKTRRGKQLTAFLIYCGGGVLLATCFIHLLPEAREGFEDHDDDDHDVLPILDEYNNTINANGTSVHEHHEQFPLPEFIVCCGFFAVYLFEEVISHFLGGHTHVPNETRAIRSFSRSGSCSGSRRCSVEVTATSADKPQCHDVPPPTEGESLSVSGLLTVAALSFHSLFEGFAVGLQKDAVSTWILFAAIAVHKFVISFVVGLEVLSSGGGRKQLISYMTVFAFMTPLGMSIAMITAHNYEDDNPVTVSVLNGIATGTLLYVTFFEILQSDDHKDIPSKWQFLATVCGFAVMCLLQYASTFA